MRFRQARALWLVPVLAFAVLVPMAAPASAGPAATVCAVAGTVNLNTGVGAVPSGQDTPGSTYSYSGVGVVCAGSMTGVSLGSTSGGRFGVPECGTWGKNPTTGAPNYDSPLYGPFCGTYDTGTVNVTQNSCSGTVGGPEGLPPNPGDSWSANFGTFINGSIPCTAGAMTNGIGVLTLQAEPLATSSNLVGGGCRPPDAATNYLGTGGPNPLGAPKLWYCQIAIEGVTVQVQQ